VPLGIGVHPDVHVRIRTHIHTHAYTDTNMQVDLRPNHVWKMYLWALGIAVNPELHARIYIHTYTHTYAGGPMVKPRAENVPLGIGVNPDLPYHVDISPVEKSVRVSIFIMYESHVLHLIFSPERGMRVTQRE
jgi:hypothetical protein